MQRGVSIATFDGEKLESAVTDWNYTINGWVYRQAMHEAKRIKQRKLMKGRVS